MRAAANDVVSCNLTLDDEAATAASGRDRARVPGELQAGELRARRPVPGSGARRRVGASTCPRSTAGTANGTWSLYIVDDAGGDVGDHHELVAERDRRWAASASTAAASSIPATAATSTSTAATSATSATAATTATTATASAATSELQRRRDHDQRRRPGDPVSVELRRLRPERLDHGHQRLVHGPQPHVSGRHRHAARLARRAERDRHVGLGRRHGPRQLQPDARRRERGPRCPTATRSRARGTTSRPTTSRATRSRHPHRHRAGTSTCRRSTAGRRTEPGRCTSSTTLRSTRARSAIGR